jgi:hypothetical protein
MLPGNGATIWKAGGPWRSVQESRHAAAAREGMSEMESDECFQTFRDVRVNLRGSTAPSLDRGLMLAAAARKFGRVPSENDKALFQSIG